MISISIIFPIKIESKKSYYIRIDFYQHHLPTWVRLCYRVNFFAIAQWFQYNYFSKRSFCSSSYSLDKKPHYSSFPWIPQTMCSLLSCSSKMAFKLHKVDSRLQKTVVMIFSTTRKLSYSFQRSCFTKVRCDTYPPPESPSEFYLCRNMTIFDIIETK